MIRAFVVKVDLAPGDDPSLIEQEIAEVLSTSSLQVTEVSVWDGPSQGTEPPSRPFPTL